MLSQRKGHAVTWPPSCDQRINTPRIECPPFHFHVFFLTHTHTPRQFMLMDHNEDNTSCMTLEAVPLPAVRPNKTISNSDQTAFWNGSACHTIQSKHHTSAVIMHLEIYPTHHLTWGSSSVSSFRTVHKHATKHISHSREETTGTDRQNRRKQHGRKI